MACLMVMVLAGCASKSGPAPVENRRAGVPISGVVREGDSRPDTYVVKKGDTLYSIALEHGHDYRDVAAWNQLDNANMIKVGQALRVSRPDGSRSSTAGTSASGVTVTPLGKPGDAAADTGAVVTGPKAIKLPYSDDNLAKVRQGQAATVVERRDPPVVAVKTDPKADPKADPKVEAKADPKTDEDAKPAEGNIDWAWPAKGTTVAGFGGASKGIDIAGQPGQAVLASAAGKVVYAGTGLRGYGKLIILKHSEVFLSAYAHNDKLLVKEGDAVKQGQRIADMGKTDADRVKLHFEIRRYGKPVDPMKYLN